MKLTKTSILTGVTHTLDIPITEESFMEWQRSGAPIQDAFPALSVDYREFMISGITPDEWQDIVDEDDE